MALSLLDLGGCKVQVRCAEGPGAKAGPGQVPGLLSDLPNHWLPAGEGLRLRAVHLIA